MFICFGQWQDGTISPVYHTTTEALLLHDIKEHRNSHLPLIYYIEVNAEGVVRTMKLPIRKVGYYCCRRNPDAYAYVRYWDGAEWLMHKKDKRNSGESWTDNQVTHLPQLD